MKNDEKRRAARIEDELHRALAELRRQDLEVADLICASGVDEESIAAAAESAEALMLTLEENDQLEPLPSARTKHRAPSALPPTYFMRA